MSIEEGPRTYIERINVRGNTRTRDYVIRREFDVSEGDAYNRALVDRAERRLKNLAYFKTVKITTEPGSAPDRVVLNVDVEEQSTGEFSVVGRLLDRGWFSCRSQRRRTQSARPGLIRQGIGAIRPKYQGPELSFVEPFFLGYRVALGLDVFAKSRARRSLRLLSTPTWVAATRLGFALREDLGLQVRYSIYQQEITLPIA